jgi:hypothetical protein
VRDAARNLAEQAGVAPGKARVVFQTVADIALLGTVLVSGALATVHLFKALHPRHKEDHPGPEPAGGDRSPPHHPGPHTAAAADGYGGYKDDGVRSR